MPRISAINARDRHGAAGAIAGGLLATKPLSRPCPKCEAEPGQSCRRWVGGRVRGQDVGGGYWRPVKHVHDERRQRRAEA